MPADSVVLFNSMGPPGSLDPIEHDALNSTIIFKNVYPRLINLGSIDAPKGYLAESWQVSDDRLSWTFHIRKDLKFEDGTVIMSEVIGKNLKRVLWLSRSDQTQLHRKLLGFSQWSQLEDTFDGVHWDKDAVKLKFSKPPDELLETLDQAIFGVVPLSQFDPRSGKFHPPPRAVAGGYYRIAETRKDEVVLRKNSQWNVKGPETVIVRWDAVDLDQFEEFEKRYDLILTNSMNFNKEIHDRFRANQGPNSLRVASPFLMNFVELNEKTAAFQNVAVRRQIQSRFYERFFRNERANNLFALSNSFLPKGALGYKEHSFTPPLSKHDFKHTTKVRLVWWPPAQTQEANDLILSILSDVMNHCGLELELHRCATRTEMIDKMRAQDFDVIVRLSGVRIRNPVSDLKLMFQSKLGARIPDPTGRIGRLLDSSDVEKEGAARRLIAEKVNDQVSEDALILTYSHSGFAFVFNKQKLGIDRFNIHNDPFDFTTIDLTPGTQS